jgi:hypothetical protein
VVQVYGLLTDTLSFRSLSFALEEWTAARAGEQDLGPVYACGRRLGNSSWLLLVGLINVQGMNESVAILIYIWTHVCR